MSGLRSRVDAIVNVTLVTCAIAAVLILVRREFLFSSPAASAQRADVRLSPEQWSRARSLAEFDTPAGPSTAELIVLVDVECPFCRRFHEALGRAERQVGDRLRVGFVHFPLDQHRFASQGAVAIECSERFGRKREFLDAVFAQQDSIGLKSWEAIASSAGVIDLREFAACIARGDAQGSVARGLEFARSIEAGGTPAVLLNGWLLGTPPDSARLVSLVTEFAAGRDPLAK